MPIQSTCGAKKLTHCRYYLWYYGIKVACMVEYQITPVRFELSLARNLRNRNEVDYEQYARPLLEKLLEYRIANMEL